MPVTENFGSLNIWIRLKELSRDNIVFAHYLGPMNSREVKKTNVHQPCPSIRTEEKINFFLV